VKKRKIEGIIIFNRGIELLNTRLQCTTSDGKTSILRLENMNYKYPMYAINSVETQIKSKPTLRSINTYTETNTSTLIVTR
jgi:hypothetical protein